MDGGTTTKFLGKIIRAVPPPPQGIVLSSFPKIGGVRRLEMPFV